MRIAKGMPIEKNETSTTRKNFSISNNSEDISPFFYADNFKTVINKENNR
jgi:hypothetical protein